MEAQTYTAQIYIAGDYAHAKQICQTFVRDVPRCVTVEPVEFVYTGGCEAGVRVGLINYPRFPSEPEEVFGIALRLAAILCHELGQRSYSIVATDRTIYVEASPRGAQLGATGLVQGRDDQPNPPDEPIPTMKGEKL